MHRIDLFQSANTNLHILQCTLQILIRANIFTQHINIHFFFIQYIRINKIFNIVNRSESQCLWYQPEKLIFNSSESVFNHRPGLFIRRAPLFNFLSICGSELIDRLRSLSLKKKRILKTDAVHQISCRFLLPFRSRIDYSSHHKILIPFFFVEFQCNVRTDLTGTLIRFVFTPRLTTDIS